jgi:hypothetical protein
MGVRVRVGSPACVLALSDVFTLHCCIAGNSSSGSCSHLQEELDELTARFNWQVGCDRVGADAAPRA